MKDFQRRLAAHGLKLGYHNHAFEFEPLEDGTTLMERFFTQTDLLLQLDTFWVYAGGADPVAWMERVNAAGRLPVIHIKDGYADGEGMPLGRGTAPVKEVYRKAVELGVPMVVESETLTPSGMEEARVCVEFLKELE